MKTTLIATAAALFCLISAGSALASSVDTNGFSLYQDVGNKVTVPKGPKTLTPAIYNNASVGTAWKLSNRPFSCAGTFEGAFVSYLDSSGVHTQICSKKEDFKAGNSVVNHGTLYINVTYTTTELTAGKVSKVSHDETWEQDLPEEMKYLSGIRFLFKPEQKAHVVTPAAVVSSASAKKTP